MIYISPSKCTMLSPRLCSSKKQRFNYALFSRYTSVGLGKIYHEDYDGVNGGYDYKSWSYEEGYKFYPPSTSGYWKRYSDDSYSEVNTDDHNKDLMDRDVTNQAKEWLTELSNDADTKPFFMAVGFKLPHLPWYAPTEYYENFRLRTVNIPTNMNVPDNGIPDPAWYDGAELRNYGDIAGLSWSGYQNESLSNVETRRLRRAYYASVSYIDSLVGELIETPESNAEVYENTIIVFTSDHGYQLGEHNMWCKNTNFEIATQVPLIIRAPGYDTGRTTDGLVELVDLFPTIVELAGLDQIDLCQEDTAQTTTLCREGSSLVPLLKDSTESQWTKSAIFHQYPRGNKLGLSMRTKEYRITEWIKFTPSTSEYSWSNKAFGREVYDLRSDTYENTNVQGQIDSDDEDTLYSQLQSGWRDQMSKSDPEYPSRKKEVRSKVGQKKTLLSLLQAYLKLEN